jgi:hypothetical protein
MVLLLVGLCSQRVRADENLDLSSPKKSAVAFTRALENADMAAAKSASIGSDEDYKFVQGLIDFIAAGRQLRAAAIERFGDEGKQISGDAMANLSKQAESASEKIDGDSATVDQRNGSEPMKLKRVEGNWKVDVSAFPDKDQTGNALPLVQKVMAAAAADVKAGKYKTAQEARQAIEQQIFAVIAEQSNPRRDADSKPDAAHK